MAQVAAVAERFPGAREDFVVADRACSGPRSTPRAPASPFRTRSGSERTREPARDALAAELGARHRTTCSRWTRAPSPRASLRNDPLARGTLLTLLAAALVALGLALVGVLLGVVSDVRDERGELEDLEAQGARPALLRESSACAASSSSASASSAGWPPPRCSALLVVDLVAVTADARATELPLRTDGHVAGARRRPARGRARGRNPRHRRLEAHMSRRRRDPRRLPRLPGARGRRGRPPGADAGGAGGRDLRRPRPERLGKVEPAPHARGARHSRRRAACACSAATSPASAGAGRAAYRAEVLGYADQHYWRALAPELEVRELVAMQLALAGAPRTSASACGELLERVGLLDRARRPPDASSRAASSSGSPSARRSRTAAAPARGRADGRAGRGERAPRLRGDRRARPRRGHDDRARQPRPRVGGGRRPDRARAGRTGERGGRARRRRRRGDRRRPRRLAAPLGGAAPAHRHPLPRGGAAARGRNPPQAAQGDDVVAAAEEEPALPGRTGEGETVAEARGLSRTYGKGAAAATALVELDAPSSAGA